MKATALRIAAPLLLIACLSACASARTLATRDAVAAYNRCVVATRQADLEAYRRCHSTQALAQLDLRRKLDAEEAPPVVAAEILAVPVELPGSTADSSGTIAMGESGAMVQATPPAAIDEGAPANSIEATHPGEAGGFVPVAVDLTATVTDSAPAALAAAAAPPALSVPPVSEEQAWLLGVAQSAPYETRIVEVLPSEDLQTVTLQTRNRSGLLDQQMEHDENVVLVQENGRWVIDKDCCEYSNARFASP